MSGRVQRVVHRHARPRAVGEVCLHDRVAAAVGEDQIVLGDQRPERIFRVAGHPIERGGRIDVPERHQRLGPLQLQHGPLQQFVEHADPTRLDHQIGTVGALHRLECSIGGVVVDHYTGPLGIGQITMLLPLEGVRLIERDAVPPLIQRADDPAIVRRRPVPVRRDQAGSEEGDVHVVASRLVNYGEEASAISYQSGPSVGGGDRFAPTAAPLHSG